MLLPLSKDRVDLPSKIKKYTLPAICRGKDRKTPIQKSDTKSNLNRPVLPQGEGASGSTSQGNPGKVRRYTTAKGRIRHYAGRGEGGSTVRHYGSLTVEAAFTVPLFLFAVYLLWIFFSVMTLQIHLQAACEDVSGQLAQQTYLYSEWDHGTSDEETKSRLSGEADGLSLSKMASAAAWKAYAKSQIVEKTGSSLLAKSMLVSGASGISLAKSSWDMTGDLDLRLDYRIRIPVLLGFSWKLSMTQHSLRKCWTGSQSRSSGTEAEDEEMVYITATGTVYHRDINCYHLKLTITEVSYSSVSGRRNRSGGKYYPCEKCAAGVRAGATVFIAREGDRYHTSRDCSGLKRTVTSIPISSVGSKRACHNCGS